MSILRDQDTMENIWFAHQKNMEEYGMGREESLKSTITKALDNLSARKPAIYRCPFCGSERFMGYQVIRVDVYVNGDGEFDGNLPDGLEASIYDSGDPYGPLPVPNATRNLINFRRMSR